jgi:tetratricopeptide (TPR) repeat protein
MRSILITFFSLLISSLAIGTYIRNQVWHTEKTLWTDAVLKAPNSMRAFLDLAYTYESEGNLQTAFRLNQEALGKISPTHNTFTVNAYNSMGNIMRKMGRYQNALYWFDEGLKVDENNKDILFKKFLTQQAAGHQAEAKQTLTTLLKQDPQNTRALLDLGNIEIQEAHPENGMETLRKALLISPVTDPSRWQILLSLSLASNRMHQFDKALFFIHLARIWGAPDFLYGLYSLENHIMRKSPEPPSQQLKLIFSSASLAKLQEKFVFGLDNTADIALDKKLILEYIDDWTRNQAAMIPPKAPATP